MLANQALFNDMFTIRTQMLLKAQSGKIKLFLYLTLIDQNFCEFSASYMTKTLVMGMATVKLNIWDTAGTIFVHFFKMLGFNYLTN